MLRISPSNLPEEAMQAVNSLRTRKEHEWALARYYLHPFLSAELNCVHAHCAFAYSAVPAQLLDTGYIAILNDSLRNFRCGHQERGFDWGLDPLHSREALTAGYAPSSRV